MIQSHAWMYTAETAKNTTMTAKKITSGNLSLLSRRTDAFVRSAARRWQCLSPQI